MYKFFHGLSGSRVASVSAFFAGGYLFGPPYSEQGALTILVWCRLREPIGFDYVSFRPARHSFMERMSRYQIHFIARYCLAAVLRS